MVISAVFLMNAEYHPKSKRSCAIPPFAIETRDYEPFDRGYRIDRNEVISVYRGAPPWSKPRRLSAHDKSGPPTDISRRRALE
jgi:hypothetical protein